jgi:hypothetical protein
MWIFYFWFSGWFREDFIIFIFGIAPPPIQWEHKSGRGGGGDSENKILKINGMRYWQPAGNYGTFLSDLKRLENSQNSWWMYSLFLLKGW